MKARRIRRKANGELVALQLPPPPENGDPRELSEAVQAALPGAFLRPDGLGTSWWIATIHGGVTAAPGDWVIYDTVQREAWPVAAKRFDELYEIDEEDE